MSHERIQWVDAGKGVAIIAVVLVHAIEEFGFIGVKSEAAGLLFSWLGTMFLVLFFFASGVFSGRSVSLSWPDYFVRRLLPLIWVFLLWQPIVMLYKVAETQWLPNQPENTIPGQVVKALVSPLRPNGELWFLWALVVFLVAVKLLRSVPPVIHFAVAAVISFAWWTWSADVLTADQLRTIGNGWRGLPSYYAFFLAAILWGPRIATWAGSLSRRDAALIVATWTGLWAGAEALSIHGDGPITFILRVLGLVGGIGLAVLLARVGPLRRVGERTLPIFLAHLAFLAALTCAIWVGGIAEVPRAIPVVAVLALTAVAVAVTLGLHRLLDSRVPWVYAPPERLTTRLGRNTSEPPRVTS